MCGANSRSPRWSESDCASFSASIPNYLSGCGATLADKGLCRTSVLDSISARQRALCHGPLANSSPRSDNPHRTNRRSEESRWRMTRPRLTILSITLVAVAGVLLSNKATSLIGTGPLSYRASSAFSCPAERSSAKHSLVRVKNNSRKDLSQGSGATSTSPSRARLFLMKLLVRFVGTGKKGEHVHLDSGWSAQGQS